MEISQILILIYHRPNVNQWYLIQWSYCYEIHRYIFLKANYIWCVIREFTNVPTFVWIQTEKGSNSSQFSLLRIFIMSLIMVMASQPVVAWFPIDKNKSTVSISIKMSIWISISISLHLAGRIRWSSAFQDPERVPLEFQHVDSGDEPTQWRSDQVTRKTESNGITFQCNFPSNQSTINRHRDLNCFAHPQDPK